MRRRLLVLGDQAVSSLSNIVVVILVAQVGTPAMVGTFALSMVVYQLVVGAIRSVVGEPLLSLYAQEPADARREVCADLLGTTLLLGVLCSLGTGALGVAVGGGTGSALVALAVVLPFVLIQDTWRYVFVIDRPGAALLIDVVWLVAVVAVMAWLPADSSVGTYVLVWGLTGALGAIAGMLLGGTAIAWRRPWQWLVDHGAVSWRYLADFGAAKGAGQAVLVALPMISGAAALGAVRAAQVFYGFLNVAHAGLYLALVPEGARQRDKPRELRRMFLRASVVSTLLPFGWMVVGVLLPSSAGRWLFAETWDEAEGLILPMGLAVTAGGALSGAMLGMRATGDAHGNLRARLYSTPFQLVLPVLGALLFDGATGFVVGFGVSQGVIAVIWWAFFARATAGPAPVAPVDDHALLDVDLDDPLLAAAPGAASAARPGVM